MNDNDIINENSLAIDEEHFREARQAFIAARTGYLVLALCILVAIALIPSLAQRIAYSTTRGAELAKREAAEAFIAAHPEALGDARASYVAKLVGPCVVGVKTNMVRSHFFFGSTVAEGQGSGVIVDSSGLIITNFHVICENGRLVDGVEIGLSDGRTVSDGIQLIGFDEKLDVAVLKINVDDLTAIEWGDSDNLEVGDTVLALGNPYGLAHTLTQGIVSAKERFVYDERGVVSQEFLQTDAAVNPGNSGGALVDTQGRLVGINTAIFGQQYQGISFALPVKRVRAVYEKILRHSEFSN
ncbi:MAG: trypsin-like peptidase domain-containing protein [Thermoguttaceae bacterium]|jgi:serine protease Do|nr:trypsin-like peptidase domain-containing protein [Thermoguttaceae bacterium]